MPGVDHRCVAHHYACDCREATVRDIVGVIRRTDDAPQHRLWPIDAQIFLSRLIGLASTLYVDHPSVPRIKETSPHDAEDEE
jgi:hypothetical protein